MITAALLISSMMHSETASVRSELTSKIEKSLTEHQIKLPLEADQKGLVRASVTVDENGNLRILESNYSHKELKDLLEQKLANIKVDANATDEVFFFEFRFEKH